MKRQKRQASSKNSLSMEPKQTGSWTECTINLLPRIPTIITCLRQAIISLTTLLPTATRLLCTECPILNTLPLSTSLTKCLPTSLTIRSNLLPS